MRNQDTTRTWRKTVYDAKASDEKLADGKHQQRSTLELLSAVKKFEELQKSGVEHPEAAV